MAAMTRVIEQLQPSRWTVRFMAVVTALLKVIAWFELLGAILYGVALALNSSNSFGLASLTASQRDGVGAGAAFGGLLIALGLWWLAYALQALLGIWRLSAANGLRD